MRRTTFGKSREMNRLATRSAPVSDALLFDVRDHQLSAELTLAERRIDSWVFAPWLLLCAHAVIAGLGLFAAVRSNNSTASVLLFSWTAIRASP